MPCQGGTPRKDWGDIELRVTPDLSVLHALAVRGAVGLQREQEQALRAAAQEVPRIATSTPWRVAASTW